MKADFKINVVCENGHQQDIICRDVNKFQVELYAKLLDGTSDIYVTDPRQNPKSRIAKCAICRALYDCQVEEVTIQ